MERMIEFLVEAKKNTYANGDALKVASSRLGSKDYHFEKVIDGKKYAYHDTYFGGEKFIGEEVLYIDNNPIWAMNYYGYALNDNLGEEAMDKALRPALMQVGLDSKVLPVRGASKFINGDYAYSFESFGTVGNFSGVEKIFKNDEQIFELKCFGGIIK